MDDLLWTIKEALDEKAAMPPRPYWVDGNASYCWDCISSLHKREEIDGGFDSEEDSPCRCENCGQLLQYTLTNYGVKEKLSQFEDTGLDWNSPDECYEMAHIAYSVVDNDQIKRVVQIALTGANLPTELQGLRAPK